MCYNSLWMLTKIENLSQTLWRDQWRSWGLKCLIFILKSHFIIFEYKWMTGTIKILFHSNAYINIRVFKISINNLILEKNIFSNYMAHNSTWQILLFGRKVLCLCKLVCECKNYLKEVFSKEKVYLSVVVECSHFKVAWLDFRDICTSQVWTI